MMKFKMRSLKGALLQDDWCPYEEIRTQACTEGRSREGTGRGQPPASQVKRPQEKPNLLTL